MSRGFGFTTPYVAGGRQVQWAVRQAEGPQTLYYRAVVYRDPTRLESDTTPPFPPVPQLAEPFNTAMEMLVERVRSGLPPFINAEDGRHATAVMQAIYESSRGGRFVPVS